MISYNDHSCNENTRLQKNTSEFRIEKTYSMKQGSMQYSNQLIPEKLLRPDLRQRQREGYFARCI